MDISFYICKLENYALFITQQFSDKRKSVVECSFEVDLILLKLDLDAPISEELEISALP